MAKDINKSERHDVSLTRAVDTIKTAIPQSQLRAVKAVNQEQLALYYVSANTSKKNWGKGVLAQTCERLKLELPGLRGFSERNLKNMRTFYEARNVLECNSAVTTAEFGKLPDLEGEDEE